MLQRSPTSPINTCRNWALWIGGLAWGVACLGAAPPRPARPAAKPPAKAAVSPSVTAARLGAALRGLGYAAEAHGQFQRIRVEEEGKSYGYLLDLTFTKSGDTLLAVAHLAPIPDLTKVPAQALLALLTQNDELVGTYFSYDRVNGRVLLNTSTGAKGLDAPALRRLVESVRAAVIRTEGLWDASKW